MADRVMTLDGMLLLLAASVAMMLPILETRNRFTFMFFLAGMLMHFVVQFLVGVALDEAKHRRCPRRRRRQIARIVLLVLAIPPIMTAYFP